MSGIVFGCIVPHPPIIVPEIGRGRESEISSTIRSMEKLTGQLAQTRPEIIIVISPHGTAHYDAMGVVTTKSLRGDLRSWGANNLNFRFNSNPDFTETLQEEAHKANIPIKPIGERGYNLDHGVLVPFYFLNRKVRNVPLVPLTFCWLPLAIHYEFGKLIATVAQQRNKRVAIVASGDLSHRLIPEAPAGFTTGFRADGMSFRWWAWSIRWLPGLNLWFPPCPKLTGKPWPMRTTFTSILVWVSPRYRPLRTSLLSYWISLRSVDL